MRYIATIGWRSSARFALAAAGPGAATLIALAVGSRRTTAAALIYLLAVLGVATAAGSAPGIFASLLSFLGLNFYFTPPRGTLAVDKTDDLIALAVFLSVGMVASTLAARVQTQRALAERRERETRGLYAISARFLTGDIDRACAELARLLRELLGLARCEVCTLTHDGRLALRAADGEDVGGREPVTIPLATAERELGTLVLFPATLAMGETERRLAVIFAQQIASALERAALEVEAREARVATEANLVRRAVLSAVSHDLRTPLASIKAAITALIPSAGERIPDDDVRELLTTAFEETERLERLVKNLLDLSRIRSGALSPDREVISIDDLLEDTLAGLRAQLAPHPVGLLLRPDVPKVFVDPVQVGQALRNVLENAAKFSPPGSEVRISASPWQGAVEVRVSDRGPGIDRSERDAVFDEFYRSGGGNIAGTGLGLAICRAFLRANDGEIWIEDTPGGGATFVVRLPGDRSAA